METPLVYRVEIQLAQEIPACCGVSDGAAAEFHAEDFYQHVDLELEENRAGHLLKGHVTFPKPGAYSYRVTGRILGKPFIREGTFQVR
jgi:hypothetical protein